MPKLKDPTTRLGWFIRQEREAMGLKQEEFAALAGIPRQAVGDLEVGPPTRSPDVLNLVAVARALRQPVLRLVALAVPDLIDDQVIDPALLSLEEQTHLAELRALPREEQRRATRYLRMQRDYLAERQQEPPSEDQ